MESIKLIYQITILYCKRQDIYVIFKVILSVLTAELQKILLPNNRLQFCANKLNNEQYGDKKKQITQNE